MVDYTPVILITLTAILNYLIVYPKNKVIGGFLYMCIAGGTLILSKIGIVTTEKTYLLTGFSVILVIIALVSIIYEFVPTSSFYKKS